MNGTLGRTNGKRPRTVARCGGCGHEEPRWVGQCAGCGAWGTLAETPVLPARGTAGSRNGFRLPSTSARPMRDVPVTEAERMPAGLSELDRVLGGGLVPGGVVLLGGEPGIGKSTLLLQACQALAEAGRTVLYVSGEESAGQVRLRAERVGALAEGLLVAAESDLTEVLALVQAHRPQVAVVDSVQALYDPEHGSSPGSVVQVRECAAALVRLAKDTATATFLVGHVTKEGTIAGPRVLEHLVDVVLSFEGDRYHALRLLRAVKNRFGAAGEVGCFEMAGVGLREVVDPSRLFLAHQGEAVPGVAVTVAVEGPRPLAVEVQALVGGRGAPVPRRQTSGLDPARLPLLIAVLERRAELRLGERDLFASAVGGVKLREPAADLAVCLATASSFLDRAIPADLVAIGEVGLAGEVRAVPQLSRRLSEAARLGFRTAVVPESYRDHRHGLRLQPARDIRAAIAAALGPPSSPAAPLPGKGDLRLLGIQDRRIPDPGSRRAPAGT